MTETPCIQSEHTLCSFIRCRFVSCYSNFRDFLESFMNTAHFPFVIRFSFRKSLPSYTNIPFIYMIHYGYSIIVILYILCMLKRIIYKLLQIFRTIQCISFNIESTYNKNYTEKRRFF